MLTVSPLMPGIDFAYDELPDLHERLDELRAIGPVVPVTYHGHGEHFCLGSHLARRELETAIERLFARFPKLRLCPDRTVRFSGGVLRGTPELWVRPYG